MNNEILEGKIRLNLSRTYYDNNTSHRYLYLEQWNESTDPDVKCTFYKLVTVDENVILDTYSLSKIFEILAKYTD